MLRLTAALLVLVIIHPTVATAEGNTTAQRIEKRYLLFPIRTGAPSVRVRLDIDGQPAREFDAEITNDGNATFWAPLDVSQFRGKSATLAINKQDGFSRVKQVDELPPLPNQYNEPLRPQFHFTPRVGWTNDPNGLVYYDGEWHLFFQYNPYGCKWGNMHWGHAVSRDLVHWQELPIAFYNRRHGDWAYSGSAVVDDKNTAGWQHGPEKTIVVAYTSTGRGECIAYSNDRGRTFTEYEGNPVVRHRGRDPKLIWHEPTKRWVMAVYDEKGKTQAIAFYTSPDLKHWTLASKLPGYYECPEIFELPVDGDQNHRKWVVFAADAQYSLGTFDGQTFKPDQPGKQQLHHGAYYASQTFSNAPDGRRIQIGWARIDMPGMPFNQTFSFPHELSLRTTPDGIRLAAEPVREITSLHKSTQSAFDKDLSPNQPFQLALPGELYDLQAALDIGTAQAITLDLGGNRITYDAAKATLNGAPVKPLDGKLTLRILVDRPMLEISANAGLAVITTPREKHGNLNHLTITTTGGNARLVSLKAHELR